MMLSDVCLSVCLSRTSGLSRKQRGLGRLKLAQRKSTSHVARTPLSRSEGQTWTCLLGEKGIACAHILLCFALLWQCRHKLGKIAQCLFFRVVVIIYLFANSMINHSLWRLSYFQLIMVRLAGAGAYCVATRTACFFHFPFLFFLSLLEMNI